MAEEGSCVVVSSMDSEMVCSPSLNAHSRAQRGHRNSVVVVVTVSALWRC